MEPLPPPPLNLSLKFRTSVNFKAFIRAQILSKEEGTEQDYGFTTSPSLTIEQKNNWEKERIKNEEDAREDARIEEGKDLNPKKKIKFAEEKPIPYFYTPECSGEGEKPKEYSLNVDDSAKE